MPYLSYTQMATWSCPHRWHMRYGRNLELREQPGYLDLGKAVHLGLAAYLAPGGTMGQAEMAVLRFYNDSRPDTLNPEEWQEERAKAVDITLRAVIYLQELGWTTVELDGRPLIETPIVAPLPNWDGFIGVIDWVARDESGAAWLVDFKVRARMQDEEQEEVNIQLAIYQHLLQLAGVPTLGTIQLQIKSATPATPKLNKDGTMSRVKLTTDWVTYSRHLRLNGLDPLDYQDMRDKLSDIDWFRPIRTYRSPETLERLWRLAVEPVAKAITLAPAHPRNMNPWNCRLCAYRELCIAAIRGGDVGALVAELYQERQQRDQPGRVYIVGEGWSTELLPSEESEEENEHA